jgi:predicted acylesterase/phospholipase RssA
MLRTLVLGLMLMALGACATDRPLNFACARLNDFRVAIPATPEGEVRLAAADDPLGVSLRGAFMARRTRAAAEAPMTLLVLSGGGQWGAYGAGLIKGWSGRGRPSFDVVTGVSTGAMQATFAFLGEAEDGTLIDAYTIGDERELVNRHGELFFLSRGSTADLAPLRAEVRRLAAPRLDQVAEQAGRRLLMVGAVDALNGDMYGLDLTRIASELSGEERLECYTAAIVASAAIPVVFRQVTVDGTPWYDGGVRQSVFVQRLQMAAARAMASPGLEAGRGEVYVLLNGVPGVKPKSQVRASLLATLGRLRAITFDQVDQSSVFQAHVAAARYNDRMTTYTASAAGHGCPDPADEGALFDPAFMACLIEKGEKAWADGSPWVAYPAS